MQPDLPDHGCALFFDFDGTLAELAALPGAVQVHDEVTRLLGELQRLLGGAVAVVSGRPLAALDDYLQPLTLCAAGVHGTERRSADGQVHRLPTSGLQEAARVVEAACRRHPALHMELKPGAIALHYRQAPGLEDECLRTMAEALSQSDGMALLRGKMVVELKPRQAGKGLAVQAFMDEPPFRTRRPWFFGDDVTDEAAFETVQAQGGVAVKVGKGETLATHRLADPGALRQWMRRAAAHLTAGTGGPLQ